MFIFFYFSSSIINTYMYIFLFSFILQNTIVSYLYRHFVFFFSWIYILKNEIISLYSLNNYLKNEFNYWYTIYIYHNSPYYSFPFIHSCVHKNYWSNLFWYMRNCTWTFLHIGTYIRKNNCAEQKKKKTLSVSQEHNFLFNVHRKK